MRGRIGAPRVLLSGGGTGGHLYPALALAQAFTRREGGAEILFLGARRGIEARVLPERGWAHRLLPLEPIYRSRVWRNWKLPITLAAAGLEILRTFREFRPDLVVGTGGYVSGPVVAMAALRGIPTAIQEQNSFPGFTTRRLAGHVGQLHLAFPEALRHLRPGRRTEVFALGNPIVPPDRALDRRMARGKFGLGDGPVLLVIGGSQGARSVNQALLTDLAEASLSRPKGLEILWATGPSHHAGIAARVAALGLEGWVRPVPYIDEMPLALAAADLAISRAGAMMLAELCAWGIAMLLVPYPYAAADHQRHNAQALADAGAALVLEEDRLAPGMLWSQVVSLLNDEARRQALAEAAAHRGHPNAANEIVEELARLV